MDFEEANKRVHSVEDQWHYETMVAAGFVAETKEAVGFVRRYRYSHPDGRKMVLCTGASADYWTDEQSGETGLWGALKSHVNKGADQ